MEIFCEKYQLEQGDMARFLKRQAQRCIKQWVTFTLTVSSLECNPATVILSSIMHFASKGPIDSLFGGRFAMVWPISSKCSSLGTFALRILPAKRTSMGLKTTRTQGSDYTNKRSGRRCHS